jgi:hypothetical protein
MKSNIWLRRKLPTPPANFDDAFWSWLREISEQLDITFFDDTPLLSTDLEELRRSQGNSHPELEYFYSKCTPWGAQREGIEIWNGHLALMYQHTKENLLAHGKLSSGDIESAFAVSPSLWPINLSQNATAFAFSDSQGRLAILNGNIGQDLGCPLALGLRNFIIMTAIAEIIWEEKNYQTYDAVLHDPAVRAAGLWPHDNPPCHPLIDAYEVTRLSVNRKKLSHKS